MALSVLGVVSAAQAEPDINHLKGSIVLKGEGSTNIMDGMNASRILDPDYSKWAWNNLTNYAQVAEELAKYEGAYKAFEQASEVEFAPRWEKLKKNYQFHKRTKPRREFRAQVDREVFVQSTYQDAIARYRDLALLEYKWNGNFANTSPWHAEDWTAFESFYCDRHTRFLGVIMEGCSIPNWRRPDTDEFYKRMYEQRKSEGRLEFLQSN
ncbi:hypothetical protein [Pseudovibrio sp. Ad46]|uniref:hypothetical protein n=1 Tax=Pseudovibrio sp. Ad46 TaxID=989432 RepID=UPI0007AE8DB0|nr:hypothetical protein [Pseudovibrio sp. Ad46]